MRLTIAALLTLLFPVTARAEVTLEDIIENVTRNEALYDELDVVLLTEHELHAKEPATSDDGGVSQLTGLDTRTRFVAQGGLFRIDRTGSQSTAEATGSMDRRRAFDGTTTRLLDKGLIGNVKQGRAEDADAIRPHMMMFRPTLIHVPLSTYLAGHHAMTSHPLGNWQDRFTLRNAYEGEEEFNGLKCHKVSITTYTGPATPHDRWDLWLAQDRNYLPVRLVAYTFHCSSTVPLGESVVDEMRQIEAGVWFPFHVQVSGFNPWLVQAKGEQKLLWRQTFVTEEVSLHPNHPPEYFSDVTFPAGTAVYEVSGAQITRSYVIGAPNDVDNRSSSTAVRGWLLIVANIVGVIIVVLLVAKQLARRSPGKRGIE